VNVPLGIVAGFLGRRALPPDRGTHNRIDIPSGILSAIGFGAIVFSVDGFRRGDPRVLIAAEFALGVVAFAVFAARQRRIPNPLLAVELFKIPTFALASVTSTFTYIAQGLAYVSLPFYFQSVLGRTPFESGLLLTSWPLATAIVAPIAGRLSDRYPAGVLSTIGLAVMSTGFALYASLNLHAAPLVIALHGVVCGIGFGFFQSPNNRELMGSAPRRQMGSAAGVLASVRLLGQTLGAALVAVVFDIAATALAGGHDIGNVVRVGTPIALWTGCGCTAFATVLSGLRNFTAPRPAESPSRS
jgi:DHA2 family multidrug resistance protein-like MFS transporter